SRSRTAARCSRCARAGRSTSGATLSTTPGTCGRWTNSSATTPAWWWPRSSSGPPTRPSSVRHGWAKRSPTRRATTTSRSPRTRSTAGRAGLEPPAVRIDGGGSRPALRFLACVRPPVGRVLTRHSGQVHGGSRPALHPSPRLRDNAVRHFRGPTSMLVIGVAGTELNARERDWLQHDACAGVILFKRNFASRAQVAELSAAIREAAPRPQLVCVDQEGGRVQRFREGYSALPPLESF